MANGSYIASAAEAERNRRFQAEQNYKSREMQKGMFGAELDFKKTQYNNLWIVILMLDCSASGILLSVLVMLGNITMLEM